MYHLNFATPEDALKGKKFYEESIREARAEVLATCITKAKQHRNWAKQSMEPDGEARAQEIVDALSMLQPTAKDLEELLREERNKVERQKDKAVAMVLVAWAKTDFASADVFAGGAGFDTWEQIHQLAELEKARAIEGKG